MAKIKINWHHQVLNGDSEQLELSFIAGGNAKYYTHFGKQFGSFF